VIPFIQSEESIAKLLHGYTRYLEAERHASPYTVRNYTRDLRHFIGYLNNERVSTFDDVDRYRLRHYIASLQEQGFEKTSISRKLSALRSFYAYLMQRDIISSNPLMAVSSPKLDKRLPSFLSAEEVLRLLESPDTTTHIGQRDRAILELLYASGLRVSEISGLNIDNLSLDTLEVRVWGKGSKERVVLVGEPAVASLNLYMREGRRQILGNSRTEALFVNRYGRRLSERSIQKLIARHATAVPTCGWFRNSSSTPTSPPPRSTRMLPRTRRERYTCRPILGQRKRMNNNEDTPYSRAQPEHAGEA
jgi:integrase/recombinase XerC